MTTNLFERLKFYEIILNSTKTQLNNVYKNIHGTIEVMESAMEKALSTLEEIRKNPDDVDPLYIAGIIAEIKNKLNIGD